MALRINNNIASLIAQRALRMHTESLARHTRRMAIGLRLESAADDPGAIGMSERLRARIRSLEQARRNANDGISLVRTAEASLQEATDIAHRLSELMTQARNGTISDADRAVIASEFDTLVSEINRISEASHFGEISLFGSQGSTIAFHVGAGATANDVISVDLPGFEANFSFDSLFFATTGTGGAGGAGGAGGGNGNGNGNGNAGGGNNGNGNGNNGNNGNGNGGTGGNNGGGNGGGGGGGTGPVAVSATSITELIDALTRARGQLGAAESRLTYAASFVEQSTEAASMALSRIRDVDYAQETAAYTRDRIRADLAAAVLAQANIQPRMVLELLQ